MKRIPTKERILYSALDLIAEKGYDGVGVDLIAQNAGLKGPSLYRHYKGKDDIFNSLIDFVASHYEEGVGLKNNVDDLPKTMDELIENSIKRIQFTMHDETIRKTRRILAMEQFRSEKVAEMTTRYHLENMQSEYSLIFKRMMERGILKQDDPEMLALEFVSPVSLLIHMCDRQPEREKEAFLRIRNHFEHFAKVYALR